MKNIRSSVRRGRFNSESYLLRRKSVEKVNEGYKEHTKHNERVVVEE